MIQHMLSIYRRVSMRTKPSLRRSATLRALALEERATPAVAETFTPPVVSPDTVQFAPLVLPPLRHEANVRADLFGAGGSTSVQAHEHDEWFVRHDEATEHVLVKTKVQPLEGKEMKHHEVAVSEAHPSVSLCAEPESA